MKRKNRELYSYKAGQVICRLLGLGLLAGVATGCGEAPATRTTPSLLDIRGAGAAIVSQEWWFLFWTGTAIFLLVTGILGLILLRQRRTAPDLTPEPPDTRGVRWVWLGGIVLPVVVLLITFGFTVRTLRALAGAPSPPTETITLVGHRWWWDVQYSQRGFSTANQLYVPAGQTVQISLTSNDVIHSFWAPQLHFKRDLIPGQTNAIWLQAHEPGVYRGLCSEYCGLQHAQMEFMVVALAPADYQAWLTQESQPAQPPANEQTRSGQQIFLNSTCHFCHTIRGTPAAGEQGPDLTHLASRLTLAGGTLPNNLGNLSGWIMDPQHIKPGSLMPATPLTGPELQALLAYLRSLQ